MLCPPGLCCPEQPSRFPAWGWDDPARGYWVGSKTPTYSKPLYLRPRALTRDSFAPNAESCPRAGEEKIEVGRGEEYIEIESTRRSSRVLWFSLLLRATCCFVASRLSCADLLSSTRHYHLLGHRFLRGRFTPAEGNSEHQQYHG